MRDKLSFCDSIDTTVCKIKQLDIKLASQYVFCNIIKLLPASGLFNDKKVWCKVQPVISYLPCATA